MQTNGWGHGWAWAMREAQIADQFTVTVEEDRWPRKPLARDAVYFAS